MKRMIIKYWYVPIVVVALLMLSLIVLITIQSAFQRITFWFLFIALITLPFSWICLLIFKERRKALLSVLWSIAAICILLIPLLIAIISDPHVPNSSSDQSNQPSRESQRPRDSLDRRLAMPLNRMRNQTRAVFMPCG